MFNLSELTFSYPSFNEVDNMQNELLSRREFFDLKSLATPTIVNPGRYYEYQEIARRYMLAYDRILLAQEPGTGKSCSQIGIAELINLWSEQYDTSVNWKQNYKRTYIIVFSELLVSEMEYQFICRCTDGRYYTDDMKKDLKSTGRTLNIRTQLDIFYDILTYRQFYDLIKSTPLKNRKAKFENCIFMLDEVHFFRNNFQISNKRVDNIYNEIYKLFSSLSNYKLVLSTATPMIDSISDIIPILNLLNINEQPRISDDEDLTLWNESKFDPYLHGKVMYVKSLPIGSKINFYGMDLKIPNTNISTKVVPILMSEWQSERYLEKFKAISLAKGNETRVYISNRLSSAIEPPPSWKVIQESKGENLSFELHEDFEQDVRNNLSKYSCKFDYIINYINQQEKLGNKKLYFIYWDLLKGGLNELAIILISLGWEYYDGNVSVFENKVIRDGVEKISYVSSYCSTISSDGTRNLTPFSPNFKKGVKRFSILSGELSIGIQSKNIKETFTHPDNRYGDYVQILIGSKVTKLGINLLNVTEMFFIGPSWNYGDFYQAMYRVLRAQSHIELLRDKEREIIKNSTKDDGSISIPDKNLDLSINVNIHKLCAIPRYIPSSNLPSGLTYSKPTDPKLLSYLLNSTNDWYVEGKSPCIDIYMYQISEEKEIGIRRIFRMLKESAIDCPMNKERNMTGDDYSTACDYRECKYKCQATLTKSEEGKNTQAYKALYVGEIIKRLEDYIILKLKTNNYLLWDELHSDHDEYREIIFDFSLIPRLAHRLFKRIIIDRYGFPHYILLNDIGICLTDDINNISFDFYPLIGENPIFYNRNVPLNNIFLNTFSEIPVSMELLDNIYQGTLEGRYKSEIFKQKILENTWKQILLGNFYGSKELENRFLEVFKYYLVKTKQKHLKVTKGQYIISVLKSKSVYLHFFFNDISDYSLVSLTRSIPKSLLNRLRIFDFDNEKWRNVTDTEILIYEKDINAHIEKQVKPYGDIYMYFNIIKDIFKVVTPIASKTIEQNRLTKPNDDRNLPRGTSFLNLDVPKLIRSYDQIGINKNIEDFMFDDGGYIPFEKEVSEKTKKEYQKILKNYDYSIESTENEYRLFNFLLKNAGSFKSIIKYASEKIDNENLFTFKNKFLNM